MELRQSWSARTRPEDPVVEASLHRLSEQYGALSVELVDDPAWHVPETPLTVRVPMPGRPLTLVLTFADVAWARALDLGSLPAAAAQVSLAMDYAALLDTERRARGAAEAAVARLGLLQSLTAALAGALSAEAIVTTVVAQGLEALNAIGGAVWAAEGDQLQLVGATDYPDAVLTRWRRMPMSSPYPTPTAARERRTVLVQSLQQRDADYPQLRREPSLGVAFAAVPLIVQDELIGAFGASFDDAEVIAEPANLAFFEAVAGQCAVALHRVAVLEGERQARQQQAVAVRRLGRLQQLTARLSEPMAADAVVEVVVRDLMTELGAERGSLALIRTSLDGVDGDDGEQLELAAAYGASSELGASLPLYPADSRYPGGEAVLQRRPVLIATTTERNARFPALAHLPPRDERGLAVLPLLVDGQPLGVLSFTFPSVHSFDADEAVFLQAIADQCAQAIARTRLREAQRRSRDQLAILAEMGRLFAASLDLDTTLEQVCRLLVPTIADVSVARVLEPGGRLRVVAATRSEAGAVAGPAADWVEDNVAAVDEHLRHVIDQGQARLIVAAGEGGDYLPGSGPLSDLGVSSVVLLPLRARGRALGLITITTATGRPALAPDDLAFLSVLSARVALSVDNARLFHHQTEIAHTLQRSLLPAELPPIEGAELAVTYLPGTEGTTVGGDFYDVIPLPSGRFGLVIGDVMGRGVRAAAAMGQLRAAIRAYALEGHPPADLLARLDRLVTTLEDGLLVTCVYAEWDPGRCLIRLASAGHPPPVVRLPGGAPFFLDLDPGMPLGVGNIDCVDLELELPPGALILAYTDGLVESPALPLGDGMEVLRQAVATAGPSATALCRSAVDSLRALQQVDLGVDDLAPVRRRHDDDIALLALVVTGPDGSVPMASAAGSGSASEVELPAEAASAARARQFVADVLTDWELADVRSGELLDTAVLLVSELVTNAVRHAGTALRLRVIRPRGARLRIEVIDHAPRGILDSRLSSEAAEGGRGLYLVETLADAWGSAAIAGGKTIWFELDGDA